MDMKNVDNLKKVIDEPLQHKIQLFMSFAEEKIRSRAIVLRKLIRTLFLRNSHKPLATSHH